MTTENTPEGIARRRRGLGSALAAPLALTALVLSVVEGARVVQPESPLFTTPFVYSLADAIESDDLDGAFAFIRTGQNPNTVIGVRHQTLTNGQTRLVSPLLWAVATRHPRMISMLLGHGARLDIGANAGAACLADALGDAEIARLVRQYDPDASTSTCRELEAGVSPLVAIASAAR